MFVEIEDAETSDPVLLNSYLIAVITEHSDRTEFTMSNGRTFYGLGRYTIKSRDGNCLTSRRPGSAPGCQTPLSQELSTLRPESGQK